MPCQTPATHFGAKLEDWSHKAFHTFHFLQSEMVLGIEIPFREVLMAPPVRKLPDFNAFHANLHRRRDSKVFPAI